MADPHYLPNHKSSCCGRPVFADTSAEAVRCSACGKHAVPQEEVTIDHGMVPLSNTVFEQVKAHGVTQTMQNFFAGDDAKEGEDWQGRLVDGQSD